MRRGYFGIGVYHPKNTTNIGTLWRSAQNFVASFMFTIGRRYKYQHADTTKAWRSMPLYEYVSVDDFFSLVPRECMTVGVEQSERAIDISRAKHNPMAVYILGAEDYGLPEAVLNRCCKVISIDTPLCLNVAVAGSIVMFDRINKMSLQAPFKSLEVSSHA